jgi:H/ACA ribonucleoprotein complex subunit 4
MPSSITVKDKPSGLVILDKPSGPTSFDCVERVGKIFGIKKTGHTGTLDPKVTGVLLILVGEARKLAPLFEKADKTYTGIMHIHDEVTEDKLLEIIYEFTGDITQLPPRLSRVKRVERQRTIHYMKLDKIEGQDATITIHCQHGTYVRKLFHDMGEKLGTGAHMKYLRRIAAGKFGIEESVTFEDLEKNPKKYLISNEIIIDRLGVKRLVLPKEMEKAVTNGVPVNLEKPEEFKDGEKMAVFVEERLRAMGLVKEGKVLMERIILSK